MRFLKNLSSRETFEGNPWDFTRQPPAEIRTDKSLRDRWINDPATEWSVFSCWEGLDTAQRITKGGKQDDGSVRDENPPYLCYGFLVDYDTKLSEDEVAMGFEKLKPLLPKYYCKSLSGNAHLLWVFEKPLKVGSFELAQKFMEVISERTKIMFALPAFDKAFFNPARLYTNGADWFQISQGSISSAIATGWLVEAASRVNYADRGYNVPLDIVKRELQKNEQFAKMWDGIDFALGAQGPTWWVPDSVSPKSAIVKEAGMYTYSSHAAKEFYSWGELIGHTFVESYKANVIGSAVEGIYFDGQVFWREITRGDWKSFSRDDIRHFLKNSRGLTDKVTKTEKISELSMAYEFLMDHNHVEGAAPFVFKPNGAITLHGKPFLNTHTARVLRPAEQPVQWGDKGQFPWLSQFFGPPSVENSDPAAPRFFKGGAPALDTFISWLAHFYKSAYNLDLTSGRNIFISGQANMGKTLLNRGIVGGIMNGYREAKDYLMGDDDFGAELFAVAHWVVDDATMGTSAAAHRIWTEMIKRMAANKTFRYHAKFRSPQQVDWQGRVVTTLNSDGESSRVLPNLERSIVEKVDLYSTADTPTIDFPESGAITQILNQELPHFCRYLLQWTVPEERILYRSNGTVDFRFGGYKTWHDPSLVQHANQASPTAGFIEILQDWRQDYFRLKNESNPKTRITSWRGSAFQLRKEMCEASSATQDALRGVDNGDIGRLLGQLKAKGYPIEFEDVDDVRYWTIHEKK